MHVLQPVLCFFAAFAIVGALNHLELRPWRKSLGRHWTERARLLWPARKLSGAVTILLPLAFAAWSPLFVPVSPAGLIPSWLAGSAGAVAAGWILVREIFPEARFRTWLHEVAAAWVLHQALWLVLACMAVSMPDRFEPRVWVVLAAAFALMAVWPSLALRLLRTMKILRPAGVRVREIVASRGEAGSPRVRQIWQARGLTANALALPLTGTLLFYDRLLEVLDDREVGSIADHEIGHLAESGWVVAGRYLGGMAVLPLLLIRPALSSWEFPGMILMLLATIGWAQLTRRLVHRMELRADARAGGRQTDDGVYARALEKIYEANLLPAVAEKSSTHPSLYDRMTGAGVTPEFPRPDPPRAMTPAGWLVLMAAGMAIGWHFMK